MSAVIGDPRKAGETGPAGDQRKAGEEGAAGDPRPAGEAGATASETSDAPAKSATKGEWVDYAVSQGVDRDEAEGMTKDALVEQYGA